MVINHTKIEIEGTGKKNWKNPCKDEEASQSPPVKKMIENVIKKIMVTIIS